MAKKKDSKRIIKIVKDYIKLLKDYNINAEKVYLYGSYAKGDYNRYSDIDIAVILNEDTINTFNEEVRLMGIGQKIDIRIEPCVFLVKDLEDPDPFLEEILRTGIEIVV